MKNLIMATICFVILLSAGKTYALPDSPFYAGVLLGDTTLRIGAHDIYESNTGVSPDINTDFKVPKSQTFSMMLKAGIALFDGFAVEFQTTNSIINDKIFREINVASGPTSTLELSASTSGVYGVYQAGAEDIFFNLLAGFAKSDVTFSADIGEATFSSSNVSYGVAVGQRLGAGFVEINYMVYPKVKVYGPDFGQVFGNDLTDDRVTVNQYIHSSVLAVGYVFKF